MYRVSLGCAPTLPLCLTMMTSWLFCLSIYSTLSLSHFISKLKLAMLDEFNWEPFTSFRWCWWLECLNGLWRQVKLWLPFGVCSISICNAYFNICFPFNVLPPSSSETWILQLIWYTKKGARRIWKENFESNSY